MKWHCDEDRTAYCSLAIARNYAYVISDLCCEHYGVQLLPDRHCPAALLDETRYELTSKMKVLCYLSIHIYFTNRSLSFMKCRVCL